MAININKKKYYCTEDKEELIETEEIYICKKCLSEFFVIDNTRLIISDEISVVLGRVDIIKIK